ncbi:MAG: hypothetical protein C5B48_02470 [Candidatus Rokuibacteriota bacterium]|nr:MAG: hypothetical protein C5B48_02470 [Candidatus Rokubacteria bacterium]
MIHPQRRCEALTADGKPCRWPTNSRFCYQHDPEREEERGLSKRLGGFVATKARALPAQTPSPSLDSPASLRQLMGETIRQVRTGAIHPSIANSVFLGISQALKLVELEVSAQIAQLEQRLERELAWRQ